MSGPTWITRPSGQVRSSFSNSRKLVWVSIFSPSTSVSTVVSRSLCHMQVQSCFRIREFSEAFAGSRNNDGNRIPSDRRHPERAQRKGSRIDQEISNIDSSQSGRVVTKCKFFIELMEYDIGFGCAGGMRRQECKSNRKRTPPPTGSLVVKPRRRRGRSTSVGTFPDPRTVRSFPLFSSVSESQMPRLRRKFSLSAMHEQ